MKTNSVSLDPDMAKALGDCTVGDTKEITLTITVDAMDDTGFRATVDDVADYKDAEDPEDAKDGGADDTTEADASGPPPPKAKKRAPALSDAINSQYA